MISASKSIAKKVKDCKVVEDGVRSDHSAICMMLNKSLVTYKAFSISRGEIDKHSVQHEDNEAFNECFAEKWDENTCYDDFCNLMMEAARETASTPIRVNRSWFEYNKDVLAPAIDERNKLLFKSRDSDLSEEELKQLKEKLRRQQKYIYDQSRVAYERWAEDHALRVHNMAFIPRVAWKSVYLLAGGESAHHNKLKNMPLRKKDGTLAKNDDERAEILVPHFQKVLNNNRDVHWEVLDEIDD